MARPSPGHIDIVVEYLQRVCFAIWIMLARLEPKAIADLCLLLQFSSVLLNLTMCQGVNGASQ